MEQLQIGIQTENIKIRSCAFTGHRILSENFSVEKLKSAVEELILQGVCTFYNGMAAGFDLVAAETVLFFKKKYPQIKLIACVPFYGQEKKFSQSDKKRYVEILKAADEKIILSENYYKSCMHTRNRYMTERADVLLAYCKKEKGGTAYTVRYFRKLYPNGKIIFL